MESAVCNEVEMSRLTMPLFAASLADSLADQFGDRVESRRHQNIAPAINHAIKSDVVVQRTGRDKRREPMNVML